MWKYVTRGVRESLERRICRTNVYSQNSQEGSNGSTNENKKLALCDKKFISPCFTAFYHGYCSTSTKYLDVHNKEDQEKYEPKYTWTDAFGWSSILAFGYVLCQSLCVRRNLFDVENANLEKWHKLIVNHQTQATRFFNRFLLPGPHYILPPSKQPNFKFDNNQDVLIDGATVINVELQHGPITADEAFKEAVDKFSQTHNAIMGDLEFNYGSKAVEEERYGDAFEHFIAGAEFSSVRSMFNLALCYELGLGTSKDYEQAVKYYKSAADGGHADAMYNLGVYHAQGKGGLKINLDIARQLFTEAANKGHSKAQHALDLEKLSEYQTSERSTNYCLEAKTMNNNIEKSLVTKLINYSNMIIRDFKDQTIDSNEYKYSYYDKNVDTKNPTDKFLEILGVHEQSAIPLISVGESVP